MCLVQCGVYFFALSYYVGFPSFSSPIHACALRNTRLLLQQTRITASTRATHSNHCELAIREPNTTPAAEPPSHCERERAGAPLQSPRQAQEQLLRHQSRPMGTHSTMVCRRVPTRVEEGCEAARRCTAVNGKSAASSLWTDSCAPLRRCCESCAHESNEWRISDRSMAD